jgi:hypothetical protein
MRTSLLLIPVAFLLFAAGLVAQTAKPAAPQPRAAAAQHAYKPTATVKDLMDYIVIPSSEVLFNAVGTTTGPNGDEEKAPKTDTEWADVRQRALLLAEAGNLLMVPGRHIAGPKDKSNNPGSELEPSQMEALVAKDRAGFAKKAQGLIDATLIALKAIDARNAEALSNAGGEIDAACESCHLTFWYPNEKK